MNIWKSICSTAEVLFNLCHDDSRTHMHLSNDAGVRFRIQSKDYTKVNAEWGVESNTIQNSPAYFRGKGDRNLLLAPADGRGVWVAEKDPGSNCGEPDALCHVVANSDSKPAMVVEGHATQTGNIFEVRKADGTVVFAVDENGVVTS